MRKISCQQCTVRELTFLAGLPANDLGEIQSCGVTGLYKPRQVVFSEGTPASGLYVLCHGAVKLYQSDRFGHDYIIDIAAPGAILGEIGLDDHEVYSASAEVLTESQLSFLPRERLVLFIQQHPVTGVRLIAALSKALAATRRKAGELALKRADERFADLLLHLAADARLADARPADGASNGAIHIRLTYSRRELAEMIGITAETAIRILGKLKRNGILATTEGEIVIVDLERLTRLAHHGNLAA